MSTALRIAAVTQVLKDLLTNGIIDHDLTGSMGEHVDVTAWPPDRIDISPNKEVSQLNLFMYQATFNPGWRNVGLPSFNTKGERTSAPPLALDLHYLLTAYGSLELHTDILLGYGMQLLHETPVLDRDAVRKAIGPPKFPSLSSLPTSLQLLSSSDLAEQAEQIKITPEILSIEDISKLWAAFGVKYRPTAAYKVTVVLIESEKSTKTGLPVKGRNIYVNPFRQPAITLLQSQSAIGQPIVENQKILTGYRLVLTGTQFGGDAAVVNIDGAAVDGPSHNLVATETDLAIDLPNDLSSGIHELQIANALMIGSPPAAHNGVISRAQSFVLSPSITGAPAVSNVSGTGTTRDATITLTVTPAVNPGQSVVLFLNEITNTDAAAYSFNLPPHFLLSPPAPTTVISFDITAVKKSSYLVRLRVDDADSPLLSDAGGNYTGPSFSL